MIDHNRIIIADRGDNRVKVFDRTGKLLRLIGSAQPRKPGIYNHNILSKPVAVAVDDKDRVWVAEESKLPKRISVWNLADGKFVCEYLGPGKYASGAWLDPDNKDIYYAEGMVFVKSGRQWQLKAIYADFDSPTYNLLLKKGNRIGKAPEHAIRSHGQLFIARDSHWANRTIWYGLMDKNQVLHPYAAIGSYQTVCKYFKQRPAVWTGDPEALTFLWVDRNHDGEMQWQELQVIKARYKTLSWSSRMSNNLDFYFVVDDNAIYKLSPVWHAGFPDYDLNRRKFIAKFPEKYLVALAPLSKQRLLINTTPLTCIDERDGKTLWSYPNPVPSNSHDSNLPKPGEIQHTLNVEGVVTIPGVGDVFSLNGNKGLRYLFTCDGIYIGHIFNDMRLAPPLAVEQVKPGEDLSKYSLMDEAFNGSFARGSDGIIRIAAGKCHHSIYKITGLDSIRRFTKDIVFSRADWRQAIAAQSAIRNRELNAALEPPPVISKLIGPLKLNGDEDIWQRLPRRRVGNSKQTRFAYQLAVDNNYFYGAFKVTDASPFINNGSDWKMLFKSGDSVNIELGADKSPQIDVSDCRLLIAPFKGKNVAILYRYKVPGGHSSKAVTFSSPVGKVQIDQVSIIRQAEIKVTRNGNGYLLKFKIPRQLIPALKSKRNDLYGDVGVIFSDVGGSINRYNLFRYSPLKGMTSDVPSEIRLTPEYWHKFIIK